MKRNRKEHTNEKKYYALANKKENKKLKKMEEKGIDEGKRTKIHNKK